MRVWGSCGLSLIGDIFLRLDLSNQASCFPTLSPWLVCAQKGLLNILQPRLPPHHQHSRSSPSCPIFPNQSDACCASQTSCSSFLHHSLEPPCTVAAPTKQSHWIQAISGGGSLQKHFLPRVCVLLWVRLGQVQRSTTDSPKLQPFQQLLV